MKTILKLAACVFLIEITIFISCKKDSAASSGHPPVADAGANMNISLASCTSTGVVELDGSHSSDPDNNISSYYWRRISGSVSSTLSNFTSAIAKAENLSAGQYAFELTVTDGKGLTSEDTVLVNVAGQVQESDLDAAVDGTLYRFDNYKDCYYYSPCSYYDYVYMEAQFNSPPMGELTFYSTEYGDTATLGNSQGNIVSIYPTNGNGPSVSGTCSVSFKRLIETGGGAFNGTFKVTSGSAQGCDPNIYTNLAPLTITGNLDLATSTIHVSIKGKVYF